MTFQMVFLPNLTAYSMASVKRFEIGYPHPNLISPGELRQLEIVHKALGKCSITCFFGHIGYTPCSSYSKAIGLKPEHIKPDSWCQQLIQNFRLFFFLPNENLSIIVFVAIIVTKKINEAVIEKIMPAKIRRHLKLCSWEVWTSAFNSATCWSCEQQ